MALLFGVWQSWTVPPTVKRFRRWQVMSIVSKRFGRLIFYSGYELVGPFWEAKDIEPWETEEIGYRVYFGTQLDISKRASVFTGMTIYPIYYNGYQRKSVFPVIGVGVSLGGYQF